MKNKLKLAIVCTILEFLLSALMNRYAVLFYPGDGFGAAGRDAVYFLIMLCPLGMLPFFIGLYRSKSFALLLDKEESDGTANIKDQNWLTHFFVRALLVTVVCFAMFGVGFFDSGIGAAYFIVYAIAWTIGVSAVVFALEAVVLFRKRLFYKGFGNLALVGMLLLFLLRMM